MTDRGIELRQLGALALELAEQGRHADVVFVDECLYAGTFDVPAPPHILKRLRELWETSKTSKRTWSTAETAGSGSGTVRDTPSPAPASEPKRVH